MSGRASAGPRAAEDEVLLEVRGLCTWFEGEAGVARAVDGIDLSLRRGETLGLVGESGCGKSVAALSILRLVPTPPARHVAGAVLWRGRDLLRASERELCRVRGREVAMVFQEPLTALNPVLRVGEQIAEGLRLHRGLDRRAARQRALALLELVGMPEPAARLDAWPHQLSGGMRQRVVIAIAMACDPLLLIADEPTTALDVTIQAQILELFGELQRERGTAVLLITHDLGVVAEAARRVCVMYAGKIVEEAPVEALFARPRHPYTLGLLRSLPGSGRPGQPLRAIPGSVPAAHRWPRGCRFAPRCALARERCTREEPALRTLDAPEGRVACHFAEEVERP